MAHVLGLIGLSVYAVVGWAGVDWRYCVLCYGCGSIRVANLKLQHAIAHFPNSVLSAAPWTLTTRGRASIMILGIIGWLATAVVGWVLIGWWAGLLIPILASTLWAQATYGLSVNPAPPLLAGMLISIVGAVLLIWKYADLMACR